MDQGDGGQVDWLDELVDAVRYIHDQMLAIGGGVAGEHTASLFAVCARPYHTFDGQLLYATAYERAAAIFHGIIADHAFADGNKRTGTAAAILMLGSESVLPKFEDYGHLRLAMLGEVALSTARGELSAEQVAFWIRRIFQPPGETTDEAV